MKKSVWLLDADMTLFDFEKAERFALREACARFGIEISPLRFHHLPRGVIGCY